MAAIDWNQIVTAEQRQAEALAAHAETVRLAVVAHVEGVAKAMGYDSAASCAGYVSSTKPNWAAEAQAFVAWRDAVWDEVFSIQAAAQGGGPILTVEQVLAALPAWQHPGVE